MREISGLSKNREMRNLLITLCLGIVTAFAFILVTLYFYNPSGSYLATNVMMSPESVRTMNYSDVNLKTGKTSRFTFDQIEFSYFSVSTQKWITTPVSLDQYAEIYKMLGNEKSLLGDHEKEKTLFDRTPISKLVLKVSTDAATAWKYSKIFQEIEFISNGDYYRIGLRDQNSQDRWAYFYHPSIYQQINPLLIP